jgi:hypothetical protein
MKSAKNFLMVAGAFTLAVTIFATLAPKTAHAFVATLVQVTNTSANPVQAQAVDAMSLHPVVLQTSTQFAQGQSLAIANLGNVSGDFAVPPGKRFIVDSVSVLASVPAGQALVYGALDTAQLVDNGSHLSFGDFYFNVPPTSSSNGAQWFAVTQKVFAYSDAGSRVAMFVERNANVGSGTLFFTVSGYLLDCPNGVCPQQYPQQ